MIVGSFLSYAQIYTGRVLERKLWEKKRASCVVPPHNIILVTHFIAGGGFLK